MLFASRAAAFFIHHDGHFSCLVINGIIRSCTLLLLYLIIADSMSNSPTSFTYLYLIFAFSYNNLLRRIYGTAVYILYIFPHNRLHSMPI